MPLAGPDAGIPAQRTAELIKLGDTLVSRISIGVSQEALLRSTLRGGRGSPLFIRTGARCQSLFDRYRAALSP